MSKPRYFCGTDVHGKVRASEATTFAELVDWHLNVAAPLNIPQDEYLALPKKAPKGSPEGTLCQDEIKKKLPYLVPAVFGASPCSRKYENAEHCNLIFLDLDVEEGGHCPAAPFVDNPQLLADQLSPFAWAAHLTASSTPEKPRLRVVVSAEKIPLHLYPRAVQMIADRLGIAHKWKGSKESQVSVQPMFQPAIFEGQGADDHPLLGYARKGLPVTVSDIPTPKDLFGSDVFDNLDDEEEDGKKKEDTGIESLAFLRAPVPEVTLKVAQEAISVIDPDLDYLEWFEIACALRHQFTSKEDMAEAYRIFDEWSSTGTKYQDSKETRKKWKSAKNTPVGRAPVTIRSLLHRAVEHGWVAAPLKEACFKNTLAWITDEDRTQTELMTTSLRRIAATPLLSHTEEGVLLNAVVTQAKKLHKLALSLSMLRQDLKKLKEEMTAKDSVVTSAMPPWLKGWAYVAKPKIFYRQRTGESYDEKAFNSVYSKRLLPTEEQLLESGLKVNDTNLSRPLVLPSDFGLNLHEMPRVYDFEYDPSSPGVTIMVQDGKRYLNRYVKSYPKPQEEGSDSAARIVRRHLKVLFPDPAHRRTVVDFMAFNVQYPGQKIRWAVLMQGEEGCGKTFFFNLMSVVLGEEHTTLVDKNALSSAYNEYAFGSQLVGIEEIRVIGHNRHDVMNALKPLITNDRITINQKFRDTRTVRNITNYFLFTNYQDALALAKGDRRYFVLKTALQSKDQILALGPDYFPELFAVLTEHPSGLRYWLENHEISDDFNPDGHAPRTKFLDEMIEDAADEVTHTVRRLVQEGEEPLVRRDLIASTTLITTLELEGIKRPSAQHLASVLRAEGYHQTGNRVAINGKKDRQYLWVRGGELKDVDLASLVRYRKRTKRDFPGWDALFGKDETAMNGEDED